MTIWQPARPRGLGGRREVGQTTGRFGLAQVALGLLCVRPMRWAVLWVSVVSAAAAAQVTTTPPFRVRVEGRDTETSVGFGAATCGSTITLRWTYAPTISNQQVCAAVQLWSTDGECGDAPGTNDKRYDDVPSITFTTVRSGVFTINVSELPGFQGGDGGICGQPAITKRHRVCAFFKTSNTFCGQSEYVSRADPIALVYDAVAPARPVITALAVQDSALEVEAAFSDSDVVSLEAEYRKQGATDFVAGGTVSLADSATSGKVRISGLANDTTYDVRVLARDSVGNTSDPSDLASGTPIRMLGFFQVYRDAGGTGRGCATVPSLAGALVLGAWLLRRRRA